MIVLGIESSCDETAAALVTQDGNVISDVIASQVRVHAPFGGVVPELASREHMRNIVDVIDEAMAVIEHDWSRVDAIAVTAGPGLVGALLIGVQTAQAVAFARGLPVVAVNHLIGHLLSPCLRHATLPDATVPAFPYIALLVSGGHTALYEVRSHADIVQCGQTRDDAAGEAFDKVAKLLGLGYPGGPRVDQLAAKGNPKAIPFPRPMGAKDSFEFSFSGLKTSVAQWVRKHGVPDTESGLADLCASFQATVVDVLVRKSVALCKARGVHNWVITGGVAANRGLRAAAAARAEEAGIVLHVPPVRSCTDNAAMIAYAGMAKLLAGEVTHAPLGGIEVFSRSPILGAVGAGANQRRFRSMRLPRVAQ